MSSELPATPIRAAIYLRISQDRDMDGLAIERQREDCLRLAKSRGWEVHHTYIDQSKSATDKTKKRPEYDLMVADYEAGLFGAIICYDLDRLTRQPRQLEDWIDAAAERGLQLVTANGDADLSTDGGRLYARIKAGVATGEVERKSARQSRAQRQRAEQGRPPKGVRPLGYDTDGKTIEAEAEAVKAIYTAFSRKAPIRRIALALSSSEESDVAQSGIGVPALPRHSRTLVLERNAKRVLEGLKEKKVPKDGPWPQSTVLGILRNPRYAGYSVYTTVKERAATVKTNSMLREAGERPRGKRRAWRDQIVTDEVGAPIMGTWEPIVDVELWATVQDMLDDPARVTNRVGTQRRHLGSGLYLCCVCGSRLRGATRGYQCKVAGHLNRTGTHVDDFVKRVIAARLSQPDAVAEVAVDDGTLPRRAEIDAEIRSLRARVERAQADYDAEDIEAKDLRRIRVAAEDAIQGLEAERLMHSGRASMLPVLGTERPGEAFLEADLAVQRSILDMLCTVTLRPHPQGRKGFDPDSVEIRWKS